MGFRIPYTYTRYEGAPKATRLSKLLNSGEIYEICYMAGPLLGLYLYVCIKELLPDFWTSGVGRAVLLVLAVFVFLLPFGLRIANRSADFPAKLAQRELSGTSSGKLRRSLLIAAAALGLLGVAALTHSAVVVAQHQNYNSSMRVLDTRTSVPEDASGVVAYRKWRYSTDGIPEQLQAKTPDEVAVIIRLTEGEELVGTYGMSGVVGYKHTLTAEWLDLRTNQVLATRTFEGGNPPSSVSDSKTHAVYGSEVKLSKVAAWVEEEWKALQSR